VLFLSVLTLLPLDRRDTIGAELLSRYHRDVNMMWVAVFRLGDEIASRGANHFAEAEEGVLNLLSVGVSRGNVGSFYVCLSHP
jgi:hypothetical protein